MAASIEPDQYSFRHLFYSGNAENTNFKSRTKNLSMFVLNIICIEGEGESYESDESNDRSSFTFNLFFVCRNNETNTVSPLPSSQQVMIIIARREHKHHFL